MFRPTHGAAWILPRFLYFTSPVTNIDAGACDDRNCEREKERAHAGVRERIGALKSFVVSGFERLRLHGRQVLYSLRYAPWAGY